MLAAERVPHSIYWMQLTSVANKQMTSINDQRGLFLVHASHCILYTKISWNWSCYAISAELWSDRLHFEVERKRRLRERGILSPTFAGKEARIALFVFIDDKHNLLWPGDRKRRFRKRAIMQQLMKILARTVLLVTSTRPLEVNTNMITKTGEIISWKVQLFWVATCGNIHSNFLQNRYMTAPW